MFLIFDTETTGLPNRYDAPLTDFENWPRLVQLAWQIHDEKGNLLEAHNHIVKPEGFIIPINASSIHGITTEYAEKVGEPLNEVLNIFLKSAQKAKYLVGHNVNFDLNIVGCELLRTQGKDILPNWKKIDTCTEKTAQYCKFPGGRGGHYKFPNLSEFYNLLFGEGFDSAHNASADVEATARVFLEIIRLHVLDNDDIEEGEPFFQAFADANPVMIKPANVEIISNKDLSTLIDEAKQEIVEEQNIVDEHFVPKHFTHLHVHSHFSILDGMSKISDLVAKCDSLGMNALALTDHGNMFGIKELSDTVGKHNGKLKDKIKEQQTILDNQDSTDAEKTEATLKIESLKQRIIKPIFGTEAYCAPVSIDKKDGRGDRGWHLILLAKNKIGYQSLCKLSSIAFMDGFYYNPRIDHALLEKYHDGLIVCSACLGGEIPQKIMNGDLKGAEESVLWFKKIFGDDFYLELQRHKTNKPNGDRDVYERQKQVNKVLLELAKKTNTKIIATNDVHFVEEEHAEAHDRLICLNTGRLVSDTARMHYTKQEWFKSQKEMGAIFADLPEALENTQEIVDKIEDYSIDSDPIMPMFQIPEDFGTVEEYKKKFSEEELYQEFTRDEHGNEVMSRAEGEKKIKKLGGYQKLYRIKLEADYLAKLAWEGAEKRYGKELTPEQRERIVFELHVMKTMGFPGYFLIVQDYIRGAREELGVSVGPGRGSAAGSVVAYCLKITDVDPLKYDLLFERFLNPDRISLPDIDVDFDDDGRGKVLDWITEKYGKEKVAHIITYGTMGSKSAIADVSRVQDIDLKTVSEIKALIPDKTFPDNIKDEKGESPSVNLRNCYKYIPELKALLEKHDTSNSENISSMLTYAQELEDTNRQIGIHACGVIIGADDLTKFAPVCTIKDKNTNTDVVVTQYDGHVVESVGLIKMDFLGLKTLTLIKDALANIKKTQGVEFDIDNLPMDDKATYDLYCAGNTVGTFQFESAGMQKYLRELQPSTFEDLIAMNALYRPGPMQYIPQFIKRKHGQEAITYDIPEMEKYLKDTYGITVYQEQVMLLSRLLANFTRGESDTLRKAMGKKLKAKMAELKDKFILQGQQNGHDAKVLEKIWSDWEQFASYAFNKSHATCYSWVAYQTAYLKAHYPAEFMAAVLNNSLGDAKDVIVMIEECKRMKLKVLGPDVNESEYKFTVNNKGEIRFGFGGIHNVGEAAIESIKEEREQHGPFKDYIDFIMRVNLRSVNKRTIESMAYAGVFDSFPNMHRAMFFYVAPDESMNFIEKSIRLVNAYNEKKNSAQIDLFGSSSDGDSSALFSLTLPECEPWPKVKELKFEYDIIGFYLSSHPMESFHIECNTFADATIQKVNNLLESPTMISVPVTFAGQITSAKTFESKKGDKYSRIKVEDQTASVEFPVWKEKFLKFEHLFHEGVFVLVSGTVTELYRDSNKLDLKINNIQLLNTMLEEMNRMVRFDININKLTSEKAANFIKLINEHTGKQHFKVVFHDESSSCSMRNVTRKINALEVLYEVEKLDFVEYKILKQEY